MTIQPETTHLEQYQIAWLIPNRVLYWKLPSAATMDDFHAGMSAIASLLDDLPEMIHIVLNARAIRKLIGIINPSLYPLVRQVAGHHRIGSVYVMTTSMMVKHHINRVTAPFGTQLCYSTSFRNTWQSLHERDTRLPTVAPKRPQFANVKKSRYA